MDYGKKEKKELIGYHMCIGHDKQVIIGLWYRMGKKTTPFDAIPGI